MQNGPLVLIALLTMAAVAPVIDRPHPQSPLILGHVETMALPPAPAPAPARKAPLIPDRILPPPGGAQAGLQFIAAPTRVTMPIMPDIPEPVASGAPDRPPRMGAAPARLALPRGTADAPAFRVGSAGLNLRAGPAGNRAVLAQLRRGQVVRQLGPRSGRWVRVQAGDISGWVFAKYLVPLG